MILKINPHLFTWQLWRANNITSLGLRMRINILVTNKLIIQKYAIGYAKGSEIPCRPKCHTKAVMFYVNKENFWTHFTNQEFILVFKKEIK